MKKLTYITLLIAGLLSNSCTSDFEEMNKSKTASTSISPDYVFTKSLVTGSGVSYQIYQLNQEITAGAWVQHWANIAPSFRADNYKPSYEDNIYDFYFATANFAPLSLNHQVIKLIQKGECRCQRRSPQRVQTKSLLASWDLVFKHLRILLVMIF